MTRPAGSAAPTRRAARGQRGGTLLGLVVGFALGLVVAAGVAWFFTKSPNPFDGKGGKPDVASPKVSSVEKEKAPQGDRPRFDFSKILPGTDDKKQGKEEPAPDKAGAGAAAGTGPGVAPPPAPATPEKADPPGSLYLQAGAYANAADAEDQRAQLALMGIEASLQTVNVPDKGTVNRVRLGPYKTAEEMNQVKAELQKRGVTTVVIRNP